MINQPKHWLVILRNNENILNVCSIPLVFIVLAGVVHLDGEIARHISASFFVVLLDLLQNLPQTFQIRIRLSGVFSNQECMRFRLLTMRQGTNHLVTERCKLHRKQWITRTFSLVAADEPWLCSTNLGISVFFWSIPSIMMTSQSEEGSLPKTRSL